jgi:ribosomal protein S18 acetylase RimI-like enzyme
MLAVREIDNTNLAHARAIYSIRQLAYTQEAELIGVQDFPPLAVTPEDLMSSQNQFLGAFQESVLQGVLSLEESPTPSRTMISSLVVLPSAQRRGVGRVLVREALASNGTRPLWVQTALRNEPALALYRNEGFTMHGSVVLAPGLELVQLVHLAGTSAIAA